MKKTVIRPCLPAIGLGGLVDGKTFVVSASAASNVLGTKTDLESVGTRITALTTGYAVQLAFRLGGYDKDAKHMDLNVLIRYLRGSET